MSHIKLTSGVAVDGTVAYEKEAEKRKYSWKEAFCNIFQQEMNRISHPAYIFAFDTGSSWWTRVL